MEGAPAAMARPADDSVSAWIASPVASTRPLSNRSAANDATGATTSAGHNMRKATRPASSTPPRS